MSASTIDVQCAAVRSDSSMCVAIERRIRESRSGSDLGGGLLAVGALAVKRRFGSVGCAARRSMNASTSCLRTRPSRPVPETEPRSTPSRCCDAPDDRRVVPVGRGLCGRLRSGAGGFGGRLRRGVGAGGFGGRLGWGVGLGGRAGLSFSLRGGAGVGRDARERRSHRDRLLGLDQQLRDTPGRRGRHLAVDLVGRDLADRLVGVDPVAEAACATSTIVPSATETPICGIVTSTVAVDCEGVAGRSVGEELTACLPDVVALRQDRAFERRARTGSGRRARRRARRGRRGPRTPRSAISAATCAPAAQVAFASSTIDDLRAAARRSRGSPPRRAGTSERRSSTSMLAPSRSSVASSADHTIAP